VRQIAGHPGSNGYRRPHLHIDVPDNRTDHGTEHEDIGAHDDPDFAAPDDLADDPHDACRDAGVLRR
jgi:hypothetical protein